MPTGGFYPDPSKRYVYRYWTGTEWTARVNNFGDEYTDVPRQPFPPPLDSQGPVADVVVVQRHDIAVPDMVPSVQQPDLVGIPGMGSIWIFRTFWLLLLAVCIGMIVVLPALLVLAGFVALALVLLMGATNISFADLLTRNPAAGPLPRGGKLVIHPSAPRITAVVVLFTLLGGPFLAFQLIARFGLVIGVGLAAVTLAIIVSGVVAYSRRRAIVIDEGTVTLTDFRGVTLGSCNRARVARITVDSGSVIAYGLTKGFIGEGAMRLQSREGTILMAIPLELFSTREGSWLARYLGVPLIRTTV